MASSANQASGSGDTNKPKKPKVKKPTKPKAAAGPYKWNGTGHHSISQADHDMHVADPLTKDPLYGSAKQQATAYYAPQVNALDTQIRSAPTWYQNYMNTARGAGTASAAVAAPVISNARTFAQNINTPAAGLDPNSPEYQKSQQAGKGISALAEFGAQNLEGNQAADQTYFQGQATNAAGALPGVLSGLYQQRGQIGSQVQGRTQELYQGLRAQAVNEDIARQTLGANIANQTADNATAQERLNASNRNAAANRAVTVRGQDIGASNTADRQAAADEKAREKAREKRAAAKTKKQAAIQKAGGKVQNQLTDISNWAEGLVGKTAQDKTKPKDPNTGDYPTRKITKADVPGLVKGKYGMLGRIALAVKEGRPLDETAQAYLHNLDPNFRIPREWITVPRKPISRPGTAPAQGGHRPT